MRLLHGEGHCPLLEEGHNTTLCQVCECGRGLAVINHQSSPSIDSQLN